MFNYPRLRGAVHFSLSRKSLTAGEMYPAVQELMELTEEEVGPLTNGGHETKFKNECRWARLQLVKAGLVKSQPGGKWGAT